MSDAVAGMSGDRSPEELVRRINAATRERDTGDIGFLLLDATVAGSAATSPCRRRLPLGFLDGRA